MNKWKVLKRNLEADYSDVITESEDGDILLHVINDELAEQIVHEHNVFPELVEELESMIGLVSAITITSEKHKAWVPMEDKARGILKKARGY